MGRIKTVLVKRATQELMALHGEKFSDNFDKNKEIVVQYADIRSRKIRNVVVGYITRLVKSQKK